MNKVFFLIFSILFIYSCSTSDKNGIIKEEFKKYVELNFDDPKSLREIVSIDSMYTWSLSNTKSDVITMKLATDSLKILSDSICSLVNGYKYDKSKNKEYNDAIITIGLSEISNKYLWNDIDSLSFYELYGMIENMPILSKTFYEIKVRVLSNGDLKLKRYYAIYYREDGEEDKYKFLNEMEYDNMPSPYTKKEIIAFYDAASMIGKKFKSMSETYINIINAGRTILQYENK